MTPDREVLDPGIEDDGRVEHLTVTPDPSLWRNGVIPPMGGS